MENVIPASPMLLEPRFRWFVFVVIVYADIFIIFSTTVALSWTAVASVLMCLECIVIGIIAFPIVSVVTFFFHSTQVHVLVKVLVRFSFLIFTLIGHYLQKREEKIEILVVVEGRRVHAYNETDDLEYGKVH